MNAKLFLCLTLSLAFSASTPAGVAMPFHPYRKVGDKYFNLQPIYEWSKVMQIPRNKLTEAQLKSRRPMLEWIGEDSSLSFGSGFVIYKVEEVRNQGLVVTRESHGPTGSTGYKIFLLLNYPFKDQVAVQERIRFLALKTGVREVGSYGTIEVFDYGVPFNPWELARERAATNAPAVRTNLPTARPLPTR